MTITRGDAFVFYSSIKACLAELSGLVDSGKVRQSDLKRTFAELECMKNVIERNGD